MGFPFSYAPRTVAVKLNTGGTMQVSFGLVHYLNTGKPGEPGANGVTFYPCIEGEDCTLSWTNDGGKENPAPVNLRGKEGPPGKDGKDGSALVNKNWTQNTII